MNEQKEKTYEEPTVFIVTVGEKDVITTSELIYGGLAGEIGNDGGEVFGG